jgi:hypothetical protein
MENPARSGKVDKDEMTGHIEMVFAILANVQSLGMPTSAWAVVPDAFSCVECGTG